MIDDERPALEILARLLRAYPAIEIVGEFASYAEAMAGANIAEIQLVFMDIDMPKLNGLEAARQLSAMNEQIEIVFVTAYNQYALAAFEMDTLDYILKPVTRKRLDKTIERIARKHAVLDNDNLLRQRGSFLNSLIAGELTGDLKHAMDQAKALGIDWSKPFSFYLVFALRQIKGKTSAVERDLAEAIAAKLAATDDVIAWRTPLGLGVMDFTVAAGGKDEELAAAGCLKEKIESVFPGVKAEVGIAEHRGSLAELGQCYMQARNAAAIGMHIAPETGLHHFLDSGFLPVLDQYVDPRKVASLIDLTIGRIIEYDRMNGTELFSSMEKIVLLNSLQSVADRMFVHYKTILFRKQSIEKILGFSMNSFAGRTMLGLALALFYIERVKTELAWYS